LLIFRKLSASTPKTRKKISIAKNKILEIRKIVKDVALM
jgi:hypothetical protein